MLSVVIPIYDETNNLQAFCERVSAALVDSNFEIIFVTTSRGESVNLCPERVQHNACIKFEKISGDRRVMAARGVRVAKGNVLAVMGGPFEHSMALLGQMLACIEEGADLVVPGPCVQGSKGNKIPLLREPASMMLRFAGKCAVKRLRHISNPMASFFVIRREVIENVQLQPMGNLLTEILSRGNYSKVIEIPFKLDIYESKVSPLQTWNYLRQLYLIVRDSPEERRIYSFLIVGSFSAFLNLFVYDMLFRLNVYPTISSAVAGIMAMVNGFWWNDRITWSGRREGGSVLRRFMRYASTTMVGVAITVGTFGFLYRSVRLNHLMAQFVGIIVATFWNYIVNNLWTFKHDAISKH